MKIIRKLNAPTRRERPYTTTSNVDINDACFPAILSIKTHIWRRC